MKKRLVRNLSPALFAILILLLMGAAACATDVADETPSPSPRNGADSMSDGGSSAAQVEVSEDVLVQFAADQKAINDDWDAFHSDFDSWRTQLGACDRTAALEALRAFASDFSAITEQARDLPGKGIARELPDNVILAANNEETSLRLLRDNWQPGNPTLLENSQTERGNASNLLRMASIEVDKLEELDKPEDQAIAEEFAEALAPVEQAWELFYDNYEELEDDYIDLTAPQIVTRLRDLVEEHESELESLEDIPSDKVTDPVHDQLVEAAEIEAEALEDLLDAFRRIVKDEGDSAQADNGAANGSADSSGGQGSATGEASDTEGGQDSDGLDSGGAASAPQGSSQGQPAEILAPGDSLQQEGALAQGSGNKPAGPMLPIPFLGVGGAETKEQDFQASGGSTGPSADADFSDHFDVFEDTLDETKITRKQAVRELDALIEGVSEEDKKALAEFTRAFSALMDDWDDFHQDFDQWVRTEGDCDRAEAINDLNRFNQSFSP